MQVKIPAHVIASKYKKEQWKRAIKIVKKVRKVLPVSSAYLMGSFTTKKRRPADIDFILALKIKEKSKAAWPIDLVIIPDTKEGKKILKDTQLWMKQKYGAKKSAVIQIL